jgi:hypothetical protein
MSRSGRVILVTISAFVLILPRHWDPLVVGSTSGAGPELTELRRDGDWRDETRENAPGEMRVGPNFVYRVGPGEAFTYIISVRNNGPLTVTLLGRLPPEGPTTTPIYSAGDDVPNGLGLLRDPGVISATRTDVVPFHPVQLGPGQEVTLVVADVGGRCADSTAPVLVDPPNVRNPRVLPFVFEVLGWRQVGTVWPQFEVTVPSRPGCGPA